MPRVAKNPNKPKDGVTASTPSPRKSGRLAQMKNKGKIHPKEAVTAYQHFVRKCKSDIRAKHPQYNLTEVIKELKTTWNELSDQDKVPYQELAKKDKKRYKNDKELFAKGQYKPGADIGMEEGERSDTAKPATNSGV